MYRPFLTVFFPVISFIIRDVIASFPSADSTTASPVFLFIKIKEEETTP
jgi:hypothetical protein